MATSFKQPIVEFPDIEELIFRSNNLPPLHSNRKINCITRLINTYYVWCDYIQNMWCD